MDKNQSLSGLKLLQILYFAWLRLKKISHKAAKVGVDSTFLSPILQQPLNLGADFVIHSTTKYINGHSDSVGGVMIAKEAKWADKLAGWGNCIGATGNTFDNYMTLPGLRTLPIRMHQHEENGQAVLSYLEKEPLVKTLYHPSLSFHRDLIALLKQAFDKVRENQ